MNKLKLSLFILAVMVICLTVQGAIACLCAPITPKQRTKAMKANADAIFTGTVLSVVGDHVYKEATFLVKGSWKGEPSREIKVRSSSTGCGLGFVIGQLYLIYGKRDENGFLVTDLCFGSGLASFRREDIKRLGKPTVSTLDHNPQSRSTTWSSLSVSSCL